MIRRTIKILSVGGGGGGGLGGGRNKSGGSGGRNEDIAANYIQLQTG
jgi:hypothetical protein